MADRIGYDGLTMSRVADVLGVRTPSLYKHVSSLEDLGSRLATLTLLQLDTEVGRAVQGRADRDALLAASWAMREYVASHPGRYSATLRVGLGGRGTAEQAAAAGLLRTFGAILRGYDLSPTATVHALRMLRSAIHGFCSLAAAGSFRLGGDVDEDFTWMLDFIDAGLRNDAPPRSGPASS
ncbi:TetR-like C-terminal domain-containing protein [Leifsonia sp. AG29]|uniref:TetR-like C-terminal domain-containing protein n=1 Tax=Leifsonia sp. AG29 TaxID=2598860 RepID=UPI0018EEF263|nr:TetR-like C-terminal domain-containing protein [Leifsonia sp. AG29]